jgi:hypothetical protein
MSSIYLFENTKNIYRPLKKLKEIKQNKPKINLADKYGKNYI